MIPRRYLLLIVLLLALTGCASVGGPIGDPRYDAYANNPAEQERWWVNLLIFTSLGLAIGAL